LLPGAGGTQRLPRLTSPAFAARLLLGGQPVTPSAALEAGLVDALAEPTALLASARELARHAPAGARWDQPGWQAPPDSEQLLTRADARERMLALAYCGARVAHLYPAVCLGLDTFMTSSNVLLYCRLHEFWRWTLLLLLFFRRRALGRGAGGKRLSGAVCGCRGKRRLGAHPTDTR